MDLTKYQDKKSNFRLLIFGWYEEYSYVPYVWMTCKKTDYVSLQIK